MFIRKKNYKAIVNSYNDIEKNQKNMEKQLGVLLESIETFGVASRNRDNPYIGRTAKIIETRAKYSGNSTFGGNLFLQRLVDLRVAFSVPNRLFLIVNAKHPDAKNAKLVKDTKEYLEEFMRVNKLDSSTPQNLAKESELQGQVLNRLVWSTKDKVSSLRYYPFSDVGYEINPEIKYAINSKLRTSFKVNGVDISLSDDKIVFIAFHDELIKYSGVPTCGAILRTLEHIEADLKDWRILNHLFAHPTPHFKCETQEEADAINSMISTTGWRIGTALATNAEFSLKGTTGVESNLLMLSIQTNAKIISGHTGVGIHFLGFSNVMSNRATAESLGEPTEVALHAEVSGWQAFYLDMLNKAIRQRNARLNRDLPEGLIHAKIVPLTDRQWTTIKEVYMPAAKLGLLSKATFLDQIPDVDADAEKERLEEEAAKEIENGNNNNENNEENNDDDETNDDEAEQNVV